MRLIDADALSKAMYDEAFENDESYNETNPMARWDSGLWIRYKMFENILKEAPTIEPKQCSDCVWSACNYNKVDWEPKQEWIPCEERLPSEGVPVLVSGIMEDAPPIVITTDAPTYYRMGWINAWMP